jgi:predicted NBD/HSP70 family sugar kinase
MLITVDTGGTKTLVTAFSRQGKPGNEFRFPTPKNEDDYIGTLSELLNEEFLARGKHIDGVVIAVPGMVKDNKAYHCPNLGWHNFDIAKRLQPLFDKDTPIWLENDANLAGLSETLRLEKAPRNSLYVTISTGIGTGIVAEGKIDRNMAMSEGGHMLIEYDGRLREWESFASGRAIKSTYGKYARDITNPHIWHQIADKISRGFVVMIPMIMPDVVIIGGSIGTYYDRYKESLKQLISEQLPEHIPMPSFHQAKYPEEAVIYGCYYYGIQQLAERAA